MGRRVDVCRVRVLTSGCDPGYPGADEAAEFGAGYAGAIEAPPAFDLFRAAHSGCSTDAVSYAVCLGLFSAVCSESCHHLHHFCYGGRCDIVCESADMVEPIKALQPTREDARG